MASSLRQLALTLAVCCIVAALPSCAHDGGGATSAPTVADNVTAAPKPRPQTEREKDAAFQAEIDKKLGFDNDPRVHFRGTVKSIEMGHARGRGVITTDFEANWVIIIDVVSVEEKNPLIDAGKTAYFNVHSPTHVLGVWDSSTSGKTFDFELIYRRKPDGAIEPLWFWNRPVIRDGRAVQHPVVKP
jgi:hypothetical protein